MIKHLIDSYVKIFGDNLEFIFVCEGYVLDEFRWTQHFNYCLKTNAQLFVKIRKHREHYVHAS